MQKTTLNQLQNGEKCLVKQVKLRGVLYKRMLDMGLLPDTVVECVGKSPLGDPAAYLIRGAVIALRHEDSRLITIELL